MRYRVLVAETAEDIFGDNPYAQCLAFDNFDAMEDAVIFVKSMMKYGKAVVILPVGEENE